MHTATIPTFVAPFLWSYDTSAIDTVRDKQLIIKNVLDYGTKEATDWVRATYTKSDITTVLEHTPKSAWSKKSLALWSLVYGVSPLSDSRF